MSIVMEVLNFLENSYFSESQNVVIYDILILSLYLFGCSRNMDILMFYFLGGWISVDFPKYSYQL